MGLTGDAKRDYQRSYMKRKRSNKGLTGSNKDVTPHVIVRDLSLPRTPSDNNNQIIFTCDVTPVTPLPKRSKGLTPEECGYPEDQVEVRIGEQGQKLWRLRGHYDMPNNILCNKA